MLGARRTDMTFRRILENDQESIRAARIDQQYGGADILVEDLTRKHGGVLRIFSTQKGSLSEWQWQKA